MDNLLMRRRELLNMTSGGSSIDPYLAMPFTIVTLTDLWIDFVIDNNIVVTDLTNIKYKINDGSWTTWDLTTDPDLYLQLLVNSGDRFSIIGDGRWANSSAAQGLYMYIQPVNGSALSAIFNIEGNICSLFAGDNFVTCDAVPDYCFYNGLFSFNGYHNVGNISNLRIPVESVGKYAFYKFWGGDYCNDLDGDITGLLPATNISEACYYLMFYKCSALTVAPDLPATTLATTCYRLMFSYCSSLTTAPVLPATTLALNCYYAMFQRCSTLNYVKAMFTTTPGTNYTRNWLSNVAAQGTFIKNSAASWNVSGVNGVPNGWTVQTASS